MLYIYNSCPNLAGKCLRNLPADVICSEKRTFFSHCVEEELGQISDHTFCAKWRLLFLLPFKYSSQHAQFWELGNIIINNSPNLAWKYARIFVPILSVPRTKQFFENFDEQNNVQGQISEYRIFCAKWRLLCWLFKYFSRGFENWGISSDISQF